MLYSISRPPARLAGRTKDGDRRRSFVASPWWGALMAVVLGLALTDNLQAADSPADETSPAARSDPHASDNGHADHGENEEEEADLSPISWSAAKRDLALWTFVIFVMLVLVLGKFAFKPIATALDLREEAITDQIASAERANLEAKDLLLEYQQKLKDSEDEVRQILKQARHDAQKTADQIVEKARGQAHHEHQRALREIEAASDNAVRELAEKAALLSTELAGKLLKREIDPKTHQDLIQSAISGFGSGDTMGRDP